MIGLVGGEEAEGEDGWLGALKSHRPKRRKHAAHDARPGIGDGSACHPKRARMKAGGQIGGLVTEVVGVVGAMSRGVEGGVEITTSGLDVWEKSKTEGVERVEGISEDMAARDS